MTKYGKDLGLGYKEEQYTKEEWNGSGDMESSYDMTHYNIDSHMMIKGRIMSKNMDTEPYTR
jgi:hypothetical protein